MKIPAWPVVVESREEGRRVDILIQKLGHSAVFLCNVFLCICCTSIHTSRLGSECYSCPCNNHATLFPALEELHVYRTSFAGSYHTLNANHTPSFCVALVLWLNLRKRHAVTPIRKLIIRECNLYPEWLSTLEPIDGLAIDWDGNVGSCRDSLSGSDESESND